MANAIDKAVRAQGGAVVKPQQVKAMVIAARRAYAEQSKIGLVDDGVDFDAWRKATLHDIVGAAAPSSFRAVTQRDYAAVVAYFRELAGEGGAPGDRALPAVGADHRAARRTDDEIRRALWALELEEGAAAGAFGGREGARRYADALLEKIHKTVRFAASAKQIWAVIFTLRKRAKKRMDETRARTALEAREAPAVPLSPPDGSKRFPAFSRPL